MKINIALSTKMVADNPDFFACLVKYTRGKPSGVLFSDVNSKAIRGKIHLKDPGITTLVKMEQEGNLTAYGTRVNGGPGVVRDFAEEVAQVVQRVCKLVKVKYIADKKTFTFAGSAHACATVNVEKDFVSIELLNYR
jgi:hypothetical protein